MKILYSTPENKARGSVFALSSWRDNVRRDKALQDDSVDLAFIHFKLDRNAPTRCTQRSLFFCVMDAKEVGAGRVCCRLSGSTLLCKLPASCTAVTTILDTNVMREL